MKHNILLVQDDEAGARTVMSSLTGSRDRPFTVDWVRTCAAGLARLSLVGKQRGSVGIAAILVDPRLPDLGFDQCFDALYAAVPHIPIVVLSTPADEPLAKGTIPRGAQDFLLKDRLDDYLLPKTLAAVIDRAAIAEDMFDA